MLIRTYRFVLTGQSPLIMHNDDVEWADFIDAWRNDPKNNELQKKRGDDRHPGFIWIGSLYHNGEHIALPAENLHRALRDGGARIPTGKKTETFKRQSQSGMAPVEAFLPLLTSQESPVPYAPFRELAAQQEREFAVHQKLAERYGFRLYVKRAPLPGGTKHVRVRPRFDVWRLQGTLKVWDPTIRTEVLRNMFDLTGSLIGLGDWRTSSPKSPGSFGRFQADLTLVR